MINLDKASSHLNEIIMSKGQIGLAPLLGMHVGLSKIDGTKLSNHLLLELTRLVDAGRVKITNASKKPKPLEAELIKFINKDPKASLNAFLGFGVDSEELLKLNTEFLTTLNSIVLSEKERRREYNRISEPNRRIINQSLRYVKGEEGEDYLTELTELLTCSDKRELIIIIRAIVSKLLTIFPEKEQVFTSTYDIKDLIDEYFESEGSMAREVLSNLSIRAMTFESLTEDEMIKQLLKVINLFKERYQGPFKDKVKRVSIFG